VAVKRLEWSEPSAPDHSSFYDHSRAISPFGTYCIEWKSWKEYPGFTIEGPGEFSSIANTLDDAKVAAQADFETRIRSALAHSTPVEAPTRKQCPHNDATYHIPSKRYKFCTGCNAEIDACGWIALAAQPLPKQGTGGRTMKKSPCPICRGSRTIRLPLYREMAVSFDPNITMQTTMEETSRQYPCPECAPKASEDNVAMVKYGAELAVHDEGPEYERYARKSLAHSLVDAILRNGYIAFTKGERDTWQRTQMMRATLGVVSAATVASMEQRIAARQMNVAAQLVDAAAHEIRIWAMHFTGDEGNISKGQAVDAIARAFKRLATETTQPDAYTGGNFEGLVEGEK
jgi:uncharacterized protein with PIN domain